MHSHAPSNEFCFVHLGRWPFSLFLVPLARTYLRSFAFRCFPSLSVQRFAPRLALISRPYLPFTTPHPVLFSIQNQYTFFYNQIASIQSNLQWASVQHRNGGTLPPPPLFTLFFTLLQILNQIKESRSLFGTERMWHQFIEKQLR